MFRFSYYTFFHENTKCFSLLFNEKQKCFTLVFNENRKCLYPFLNEITKCWPFSASFRHINSLHYLYKKAPYNSFYCYIEPLPFFYFSVSLDTIAGIRIVKHKISISTRKISERLLSRISFLLCLQIIFHPSSSEKRTVVIPSSCCQ